MRECYERVTLAGLKPNGLSLNCLVIPSSIVVLVIGPKTQRFVYELLSQVIHCR